jgi:uncharacterized coiled-coil protein SlyX
MSDQDHEEQARKLDHFHDKHSPLQRPDWLKAEASGQERRGGSEAIAKQDFAPIMTALRTLTDRLDTLRSIGSHNILIPGGPQARYHELIEEASAALSRVETEIDELRTELEYQHKRLDDIRDTALAENQTEEEESEGGTDGTV